jgi:hypothetical protein
MNTRFLLLLNFLFVSLSSAQAHAAVPSTTFLDVVKTGNTKALQAFGVGVEGREYREMRFNDAIIEAANMDNLDALRYLDRHACNMYVGSTGWMRVFGIAKEHGNMDVLRYLFMSQHIHLSTESYKEYIVDACNDDNVELLKMFLLHRPHVAGFISPHLKSESSWERLSWLLDSASILDLLRLGKSSFVADELLSDELIAFVFSPSSFGLSPETIKDLFLVLQRRYEGSTLEEYARAILRHNEDGNVVIAKFLHALAVNKMKDVGAFAAEVVQSQKP